MRILVFNPSYPPVACGVGNYTRGLAEALVRAGHDVTVVTGPSATATADNPRVLALLREWDIGAFLRAWPRFSRPRPDVVVSGFPSVIRGKILAPAVPGSETGEANAWEAADDLYRARVHPHR